MVESNFVAEGGFQFYEASIDITALQAANSREQFLRSSAEIVFESESIIEALVSVVPSGGTDTVSLWNRNEAIRMGLMQRLAKLANGFVHVSMEDQRELAEVLLRPICETGVNLVFLCREGTDEHFDSYIKSSLRADKTLLDLIERNVMDRNSELPIEARMKESILRAFRVSNVNPIDFAGPYGPWAEPIVNRFQALGLADLYISAMRVGSHATHGNWQDLLTHHLVCEGLLYRPAIGWTKSHPGQVMTVATILCFAATEYLSTLIVDSSLSDLFATRVRKCVDKHDAVARGFEAFVQSQEAADA